MSNKQHNQAYSKTQVHEIKTPFTSVSIDVDDLLTIHEASPVDFSVYFALKRFAGAEQSCWPSRDKIAKRARVKSTRSVDKSVAFLERIGLVEKYRRYRNSSGDIELRRHEQFTKETSSLYVIDEARFVARHSDLLRDWRRENGLETETDLEKKIHEARRRREEEGGTRCDPRVARDATLGLHEMQGWVARDANEEDTYEVDSTEVDSTEVNTRSTASPVEHARAGDDEIAEAHQTTSDATRTSTPHTQSSESAQPVSELLVSGNDEPVQGELVPIVEESKRAVAKRSSKKYSDDFLEFWQHYPRRQGKGTAQQAFDKVIAQGADVDEIIEAARRFAMLVKVQQTEARFVALPSTWLNQWRFDDDYEQLIKTAALEASSSSGARANTLSSWSRPSEAVERERLLAELAGVGDEYERATSNFGFDALKAQQQSLD